MDSPRSSSGCSSCPLTRNFQASTDLAATYAALILADEGIEITVRATLILPAVHQISDLHAV